MVDTANDANSIEFLQLSFNIEVETDKRVAAETAYALANRYRNEDIDGIRRFDIAKLWANRAIDILDSLPCENLGQVACTRLSVGGVDLPAFLHSNIVRQRLADLLI